MEQAHIKLVTATAPAPRPASWFEKVKIMIMQIQTAFTGIGSPLNVLCFTRASLTVYMENRTTPESTIMDTNSQPRNPCSLNTAR